MTHSYSGFYSVHRSGGPVGVPVTHSGRRVAHIRLHDGELPMVELHPLLLHA